MADRKLLKHVLESEHWDNGQKECIECAIDHTDPERREDEGSHLRSR
jgi:hypothetical protein